MSIAAKVRQIVAEEADGALKALHALAEHVDQLVLGGAASPESVTTAVEAAIEKQLGPVIAEIRPAFEAGLKNLTDAQARADALIQQLEAKLAAPAVLPAMLGQPGVASAPPAATPATPAPDLGAGPTGGALAAPAAEPASAPPQPGA